MNAATVETSAAESPCPFDTFIADPQRFSAQFIRDEMRHHPKLAYIIRSCAKLAYYAARTDVCNEAMASWGKCEDNQQGAA